MMRCIKCKAEVVGIKSGEMPICFGCLDDLDDIEYLDLEDEWKRLSRNLAPWGRVLAIALNADRAKICFHCISIFEYHEPCNFCDIWEFHKTKKKPEWMEEGCDGV